MKRKSEYKGEIPQQDPKKQKSATNSEGLIADCELLGFVNSFLQQLSYSEAPENYVLEIFEKIPKDKCPIYFISSEGQKLYIAIQPNDSIKIDDILLSNNTNDVMSLILLDDGSYGLAPVTEVLGFAVLTCENVLSWDSSDLS